MKAFKRMAGVRAPTSPAGRFVEVLGSVFIGCKQSVSWAATQRAWVSRYVSALLPLTILLGCDGDNAASSIRYALLDSDSVVVGQIIDAAVLREEKAMSWGDRNSPLRDAVWVHGRSKLVIQEKIWGDFDAGEEISVAWIRATGLGIKRGSTLEESADVDYESLRNTPRIWLLGKKDEGLIVERILRTSARPLVQALLKGNPLRVKDKSYQNGRHVTFALEFRNADTRPIEVPRLEQRPGGLFHGPGISLELRSMGRNDRVRTGRTFLDPTLGTTRLEPGQAIDTMIDWTDVFEFKECEGGMLWIEVTGVSEPVLEIIAGRAASGDPFECDKTK